MTKPRLFLSLLIVAVFMAACSPGTSTVVPVQPPVVQPSVTVTATAVLESTPSVDWTATYMLELLSATPPVDAQPIATSRGSNLEATDPGTVSMAAGGL